ncbi:hypothetical protein ACQWU4_19470 [Chryseobacterium sp. MIQD13]|uniref:hypothetical protein n=1 Tax=Chryseobacterium sp. MIQD13 TaxID=3422310 RepID=UPI003D2C3D51
MKKTILLSVLLFAEYSFGQIGISTSSPKVTMDIASSPTDLTKADGLIAPRLTGDELKLKDGLYTTDQTGAIVYITAISAATTPKTINIIETGYYFFDGSIWMKMNIEPWKASQTQMPATLNNQDIYQMGKVGINTIKPVANLDVRGAVRFGLPHTDEVNGISPIGTNSMTAGSQNLVSGTNSVAFGQSNNVKSARGIAVGGNNILNNTTGSMVVGDNNELNSVANYSIVSGVRNKLYSNISFIQGADNTVNTDAAYSTVFGNFNTIGGSGLISYATSFGTRNSSLGHVSTTIGSDLIAKTFLETVIGKFNEVIPATSDPKAWIPTDPILQIGIGDSNTNRKNALTVYKNGVIQINQLKGIGNAYACIDTVGVLFRSSTPCTP